MSKDLESRTILVTGATDGIGRLTAARLAGRGATVLLHGRDDGRIEQAVDELGAAAGHERVVGFRADLADLSDVSAMAARILDERQHLDVLINNAGIGTGPSGGRERQVSRDGHELRFQVNYLAQVLLTRLLLPLLSGSAPARIVNVASAAQTPIDFDDPMLERGYDGMRAYAQSKLAMVMFTFDLAERLEGTGVTVNALHPGSLLDTKMVREGFGRARGPAEEGAEAEVYLATAPELEGVTGRYFDGTREARASRQAYDAAARRRLRELTDRLLPQAPGA